MHINRKAKASPVGKALQKSCDPRPKKDIQPVQSGLPQRVHQRRSLVFIPPPFIELKLIDKLVLVLETGVLPILLLRTVG